MAAQDNVVVSMPKFPSEEEPETREAKWWLERFEAWARHHQHTPETKLALVAFSFANTSSAAWQIKTSKRSADWPAFVATFKARFLNPLTAYEMGDQVRSLRQGKTESITHFGDSVDLIVDDILESVPRPTAAELDAHATKKEAFEAGIASTNFFFKKLFLKTGSRPEFATTLQSTNTLTEFTEILQICKAFERTSLEKQRHGFKANSVMAIEEEEEEEEQLHAISKAKAKKKEKDPKTRPIVTCADCGLTGPQGIDGHHRSKFSKYCKRYDSNNPYPDRRGRGRGGRGRGGSNRGSQSSKAPVHSMAAENSQSHFQ